MFGVTSGLIVRFIEMLALGSAILMGPAGSLLTLLADRFITLVFAGITFFLAGLDGFAGV